MKLIDLVFKQLVCLTISLSLIGSPVGLADDDEDQPFVLPPEGVMYRDAMYHYIDKERVNKPWLDVAVHGYVREIKSGGTIESATLVFNALADFGNKRQALHGSGTSWNEELEKERRALEEEFFDTLKGYGGSKTALKVGTDALSVMTDHIKHQNKAHGPSDEMRWETYAVDRESAKAFSEKRKESAENFARSRKLGGRYSSNEFIDGTKDVSEPAMDNLGNLLEDHTGFKNIHDTGKRIDSLHSWGDHVRNMIGVTVLEWMVKKEKEGHSEVVSGISGLSGRLGKLEGKVGKLELTADEIKTLVNSGITLITNLQAEITHTFKKQEERDDKTKKQLEHIEKILQDRFDKEDRERLLAFERQLAQQLFQEKLSALDSASNLFRSFGAVSGDKDFNQKMQQLADLVQATKKFEQLRMTAPISNFGRAAVALDYVSLGIQFISLACGIGTGPSPDEVILQAIINLTKQMHERFDRVEMQLADFQRAMQRNFRDVFEALEGIQRKQQDAKERLEALQKTVGRLERTVDFYGKTTLDILAGDKWGELTSLQSRHVTRVTKPFTDPDVLANALREFVEHGVVHSWKPALIGSPRGFEKAGTAREALKRLDALAFSSGKLDGLLRLEVEIPKIRFPVKKPIPEEDYWIKAAESFATLVERNNNRWMLPVTTVQAGIVELRNAGGRIRDALVAGRQADRFDLVVRGLGNAYRNSLAVLDDVWQATIWRTTLGLPITAQGLKGVFDQRPGEDPAQQKADLSHWISADNGFNKGKILFKTSSGQFVEVKGGWGIIPPSMRALAHFGAQLHPDAKPSPKDYEIHIWVDEYVWGAPQKIDEKTLSNIISPRLRISTPQMGTSFNILFTHERLRQTMTRDYGKKPKGKASIQAWEKKYKEWIQREIPKAQNQAIDALAADWDNLVREFLQTHPDPWPLGFGLDTRLIFPVMEALREGIAADIKRLILRPRDTKVVFAEGQPAPYSNDLKLTYLPNELGNLLDNSVDDLAANQQILIRHIFQFAPDYLLSRAAQPVEIRNTTLTRRYSDLEGEPIGIPEWINQNLWGPALLAEASQGLLGVTRMTSKLRVREKLAAEEWERNLGTMAYLKGGRGQSLRADYRAYLASVPEGMDPQCMKVDAALEKLNIAEAEDQELKRILAVSAEIEKAHGLPQQ